MFSIIKDGAMIAKRDLDAENRRFMIVHGQVRTGLPTHLQENMLHKFTFYCYTLLDMYIFLMLYFTSIYAFYLTIPH